MKEDTKEALHSSMVVDVDPDINRHSDALWYCYAVLSTAGFDDIVAMTFIGKLVSVLVTIYTILVRQPHKNTAL